MDLKNDNLNETAKELRRKIFKMIYRAGGGHIAPAFSIVEILTALYFGGVLKYDALNPQKADRDRLVLSKGHAGSALYAALSMAGFIDEKLLYTYCQPGSILGGHPNMHDVEGVEASTGALGHGFLYAEGIALSGKLDKADYHVYAILGDGECQEGSIWEAALFAAHMRLGKFTAIVDYNKLQAMDRLEYIIGMEPFAEKWKAFGWKVIEVDGHDIVQLVNVLSQPKELDGAPNLIIAHTIKGKGISFMENVPIWHNRLPNNEEMKIVYNELEITEEWVLQL